MVKGSGKWEILLASKSDNWKCPEKFLFPSAVVFPGRKLFPYTKHLLSSVLLDDLLFLPKNKVLFLEEIKPLPYNEKKFWGHNMVHILKLNRCQKRDDKGEKYREEREKQSVQRIN